jgi:hypothetical protein
MNDVVKGIAGHAAESASTVKLLRLPAQYSVVSHTIFKLTASS